MRMSADDAFDALSSALTNRTRSLFGLSEIESRFNPFLREVDVRYLDCGYRYADTVCETSTYDLLVHFAIPVVRTYLKVSERAQSKTLQD